MTPGGRLQQRWAGWRGRRRRMMGRPVIRTASKPDGELGRQPAHNQLW